MQNDKIQGADVNELNKDPKQVKGGVIRTLLVKKKDAWGRTIFEPQNDTAKKFCELLGQQTLTLDNLITLQALDYTVELVVDNPFKQGA